MAMHVSQLVRYGRLEFEREPSTTRELLAGTSQSEPLRVNSMTGGNDARSNVTDPATVAMAAPVALSRVTCTYAVYSPTANLVPCSVQTRQQQTG